MPGVHRIALSFDDGPDTTSCQVTRRILDILKSHRVRSTFFCVGRQVVLSPELLKQATDDGHMICNHSWSHAYPISSWLTIANDERLLRDELTRTNDAILAATQGIPARCYRPPYGETGKFGEAVARELNLLLVKWSNDTVDWSSNTSQAAVTKVITNASSQTDILMHDAMKDRINPLKTVRAIEEALIRLGDSRHYVSELELHYSVQPVFESYADDPGGRRYSYSMSPKSAGPGWTKNPAPVFYVCANAVGSVTVPIYRFHRVIQGAGWELDYRPTSSPRADWTLDGVWWNAYSAQRPGLLPVYAYVNPSGYVRLTTNVYPEPGATRSPRPVFFG